MTRPRFDTPFFRALMVGGVRALPPSVRRATMPLWGGLFHALAPAARRAVEGNLARVLDERDPTRLRRAARRLFVNYAWAVTHRYSLGPGRLPFSAILHGREHYDAAMAAGRGAILATGHLGFWTLAPFVMAHLGFPVPTMAMAEEPDPRLHAWEQRWRRGWSVVYTTGSPFASLGLVAALGRGEAVAIQMDRAVGERHVEVPFFGRPARFPVGPAVLSRLSGAPILPVFMLRDGAHLFRAHVEPPVVVPRGGKRDEAVHAATVELVRVYERFVREHPEQWFNFFDFWADAPGAATGGAR